MVSGNRMFRGPSPSNQLWFGHLGSVVRLPPEREGDKTTFDKKTNHKKLKSRVLVDVIEVTSVGPRFLITYFSLVFSSRDGLSYAHITYVFLIIIVFMMGQI